MSNDPTRQLAKGVGRAFGGALLFSLPILMTMEMWRPASASTAGGSC